MSSAALPATSLPGRSRPPAGDPPAGAALEGCEPLSSELAQQLLRALADPIRLQVLEALGQEERCVCELTADLRLAQSKLSFHLRVMREAGLISARQQGRWMYYRLQPTALLRLRDWLDQLRNQPSAAGQTAAVLACRDDQAPGVARGLAL